jgi:hypothetical protein
MPLKTFPCATHLFPSQEETAGVSSGVSSEIEVDFERFVEAVGDLGDAHGQIELDQLLFAQPLLELVHECFRDTNVFREFFGVLDDQLLQIVVYRTAFIVRKLLDLLFGESRP